MLQKDQVISVSGGVKHARRNTSDTPCTLVVVSNGGLYDFFKAVVMPIVPGEPQLPPVAEQMHKLFAVAAEHHYWTATPEENASIGLLLPPMPVPGAAAI